MSEPPCFSAFSSLAWVSSPIPEVRVSSYWVWREHGKREQRKGKGFEPTVHISERENRAEVGASLDAENKEADSVIGEEAADGRSDKARAPHP